MKILASFLCTFLLLMLVGTVSYVYILWHHYWVRVERLYQDQEEREGRQLNRHRYERTGPHHRRQTTTTEPTPTPLPPEKLLARVTHYETQIITQLRNAVVETGKAVRAGEVKNAYDVEFKGQMGSSLKPKESSLELVCDLSQSVQVSTFSRGDPFFHNQQLDKFFTEAQLMEKKKGSNGFYETCGVVSSAGSLKNSGLGKKIDENEFVIRFNNAPAGGTPHARDVGSKTSLRVVNSQVVGKPEFGFLESNPARNGSRNSSEELLLLGDFFEGGKVPVLVWDPSAYGAAVADWYRAPDYPFFETFFARRLMRPEEPLHLLKPDSLWSVWDWLQSHTKHPLLPNPPSSGFLGLVLALLHCNEVRVYEYVPSVRLTKRCHYYGEEENLGCTVGDWHPLAAEKLAALALNTANASVVYAEGFLVIRGAPAIDCKRLFREKTEQEDKEKGAKVNE